MIGVASHDFMLIAIGSLMAGIGALVAIHNHYAHKRTLAAIKQHISGMTNGPVP
jgi:hypothetical protein